MYRIFGATFWATARSSRPCCARGDRVAQRQVGEGVQIGRVQDGVHRLRVARRLGEAVVEVAPAGAGDVRDQAVEHRAAVLVGVEALVQEVAQEAPALRDAHPQGGLHPQRRAAGRA